VPLVVAAAAVVVLTTAVEGPAVVTRFAGGVPGRSVGSSPRPPAVQPIRPGSDPGLDLTVVLQVLACLLALAVVALLIRVLISALRWRRRRRPARAGVDVIGAGTAAEVADAPTVLRGIAAALAALQEHREPTDAVVQAWLGLQQAAEDAGFARSPAETPTEFTGRVLSRTGADRAALRTLLRLYLRARFGDGAITVDDATDARAALLALEASWEDATVADRR
jgi:hypothetical protein